MKKSLKTLNKIYAKNNYGQAAFKISGNILSDNNISVVLPREMELSEIYTDNNGCDLYYKNGRKFEVKII